ncbi:MAG: hypothetical protein JJ896_02985 [Rhodothermales bacterium]|nr:hypothetical protein [Rhodothermales bacterium]
MALIGALLMPGEAGAQAPDSAEVSVWREALRNADTEQGSEAYLDVVDRDSDHPLAVAFRASAELISVGYKGNPFSKLRRFRAWSKELDRQVEADSLNPEIRFLRMTVKDQAPRILAYRSGVVSDCVAVRRGLEQGYWRSDPVHRRFVQSVLEATQSCP